MQNYIEEKKEEETKTINVANIFFEFFDVSTFMFMFTSE